MKPATRIPSNVTVENRGSASVFEYNLRYVQADTDITVFWSGCTSRKTVNIRLDLPFRQE